MKYSIWTLICLGLAICHTYALAAEEGNFHETTIIFRGFPNPSVPVEEIQDRCAGATEWEQNAWGASDLYSVKTHPNTGVVTDGFRKKIGSTISCMRYDPAVDPLILLIHSEWDLEAFGQFESNGACHYAWRAVNVPEDGVLLLGCNAWVDAAPPPYVAAGVTGSALIDGTSPGYLPPGYEKGGFGAIRLFEPVVPSE